MFMTVESVERAMVVGRKRRRLCWLLIALLWDCCTAQISYSISEEMDKGTVVGNLAKDLNVNVRDLQMRDLNVVSSYSKEYFKANFRTGELYVAERIDRDELCPKAIKCTINIEAILRNPMGLHRIEVVVDDLNDNAPRFVEESHSINVSEISPTGEHFLLPLALDSDTAGNSVKTYKLSQNEYFSLEVQGGGEHGVSAELVLIKALDREKQATVKLTLSAIDGGKPPKTGTLEINVNVLDVNDNTPSFSQALYKARVKENALPGSLVIQLSATDLDEGDNGKLLFAFVKRAHFDPADVFLIDAETGEITVKGLLDYETQAAYDIHVQATDKSPSPRRANAKLLVEVLDVNDNAPEIVVTSLMNPVKEDAEIGSVVALVTVTDEDGGKNGNTQSKITGAAPFKLKSNYKNYYSLVVDGLIDREECSMYNVTIVATDEGSPQLSSSSVITIQVSDVNDNAPHFPEPIQNIYVKENSPVGVSINRIIAVDSDINYNARVTYALLGDANGIPITSVMNIHSENGDLVSLQSFDYEKLKTFQFKVQATDSGVPPLSSNVTVNVFVLDENDNSPTILPPYSEHSSVNSESIPYSAEAGYFVAKIRAVDADSGYNALLSYHLSEPKGNNNLFRIGTSTGEIRTKRRMSDNDLKSHPLVVLVCDHGEASLSATVSIDVVVLESTADIHTPFRHVPIKEETFSDLHLYLLIAIVAVSLIFLLSLIILIAVRCHKKTDGTFGSSDTLKSDVVVFPTPFPPVDAELISINGGDTFTRTQTLPNTEKPKAPNSDWRYSASLRAGGVMQSSVHMEESSVMQGAQGVLVQNWPTASSAADAEGGEVSPPMGAGVDSNSWHFRYGPGGPGAPPQHLKPGEVPPEAFIIPGSPAIISIRQNQGGEDDKSDFITFGKKEEAKKKKKKKKDKKDKKDKGKDDDE
ncbi:protocadherin alpha-13-like isoform X32 [Dunckerocampus dactyliophorus]|uniref:protocadherin alpha-13-like isoform X32 n=1 Tax=Dunckerocampus dactyliophorus TaxID=161453 RepID=UPI0024073BDD|nr:protocadherin alpha-13-like isoform X32 [Dunckerocampus dactyliophorus]